MKYKYLVYDVNPAELEKELNKSGLHGWEFCQVIILQIMIPGINISGQPKIEMKYQLIFKKPDNGTQN